MFLLTSSGRAAPGGGTKVKCRRVCFASFVEAKRRKTHCFCREIRFTVTSSFGSVGGGEEKVKGAGGRDGRWEWVGGWVQERIEEARVKKEKGNGGRKVKEGRNGK